MKNTKFNIKKGNQYLCKRNFRECGDIRFLYVQGRTYLSEVDGCITDELGEKDLEWDKYIVSEYFEEVLTTLPKNWVVKGMGGDDDGEVYNYLKQLLGCNPWFNGKSNSMYYGVINGVVDAYHLIELTDDTVILTLDEFKELTKTKETEMKNINQRISRENLKEIVDVACDVWQRDLCEKAKEQDALSSFIEFDNEFVLKMYKAATSTQKVVLDKFLKKPEAEDLIAIPKDLPLENYVDQFAERIGLFNKLCRLGTAATKPEYQNRGLWVDKSIEVMVNKTNNGHTEIVFLNKEG